MTDDRRASARVEILGELAGEIMVYQPMTVRQVSAHGTQVETTFPLQLDSVHELRLALGDQSVIVKGRVVQCQVSDVEQEHVQYRSGLEFVDMPERVLTVLKNFIEAMEAQRKGSL